VTSDGVKSEAIEARFTKLLLPASKTATAKVFVHQIEKGFKAGTGVINDWGLKREKRKLKNEKLQGSFPRIILASP
jgi:hypothetical protein